MTLKSLTTALILALATAATITPAAAEGPFIAAQKQTEYLAKDRLLGAKVYNDDGKIIGDVEDLIITNDGQVVGVIMGVGGFLGLGEKRLGVERSALHLEATDGKIKVTLPGTSKELLESTPAFERVKPAKGWMQRAVEKGRELRDKSAVTAKEAYDAAKEKTAPLVEKAKDAAGNVIDKAKEAAKPTTPVDTPATSPATP